MKKFVTTTFLITIALAVVMASPGWCKKLPQLKNFNKQDYQITIDCDTETDGVQSSVNLDAVPNVGAQYPVDVIITVADSNFSNWNAADFDITVTGADTTTFAASGASNNALGTFAAVEQTATQTQIKVSGAYGSDLGNDPVAFYRVTFTMGTAAEGTISFSLNSGEISNGVNTVPLVGVDASLSWGGPVVTETPTETPVITETPTPTEPIVTETPTPTETEGPTVTPTETPAPGLGVLFVDRIGGLHGMNYTVPQGMKDDLIAGNAYWNWDIGRDFELFTDTDGGIIHMDGFAGVHFGLQAPIPGGPYFMDYTVNPIVGTDKAVDLELTQNESGYVLLDSDGVLYPVNASEYDALIGSITGSYLADGAMAVDMEFTAAYDGIYILDDMGNIYGFGNVIKLPLEPMIVSDGSLRTIDLELSPDPAHPGLYILDTYGDIHTWPATEGPEPISDAIYFGWDVAEDLELIMWNGNLGSAVLDALGIVHPYGSVINDLSGQQPYFFGWDIAEGLEFVVTK